MNAACIGCSASPSRQALDGGDLVPVVHHREGQAGVDAPAVDQHRAGAALAVVAALLGAGQAEVLAQRVEQRHARLEPAACDSWPFTLSVMFTAGTAGPSRLAGLGLATSAVSGTVSRPVESSAPPTAAVPTNSRRVVFPSSKTVSASFEALSSGGVSFGSAMWRHPSQDSHTTCLKGLSHHLNQRARIVLLSVATASVHWANKGAQPLSRDIAGGIEFDLAPVV